MSGSVNKVILVGNLGADPEIRDMGGDRKVANLRIATSETWKDKSTGERKEKTEWHSVAVFVPGLVGIIGQYCKKGDKVYLEGQLATRKYDKNGQDHYATEVQLTGPGSVLTLLSGPGREGSEGGAPRSGGQSGGQSGGARRDPAPQRDYDDDVPF